MQNLLIVFGSTMGNTESVARSIADQLKEKTNTKVVIKNVKDTSVEELSNYKELLLGSSTWGDGELQDDMVSFHEELGNISLSGVKSAAFGTGEKSWPQFCKAVDDLEEQLNRCEAEVVPSLKIDFTEGDFSVDVSTWVDSLIENWS